MIHPTSWVVCFTVSNLQVNRSRRLPLAPPIRLADFTLCMHVACRFTGDTVAYTLPSCNRPPPTVHNYSPLSFEPLGATITQETPFTSHSTLPWTILSPNPPIASAACSSFASSSIDLRFPPLLPPIDLLQNQVVEGAVPEHPDAYAPPIAAE